jgi:hypothetical protein
MTTDDTLVLVRRDSGGVFPDGTTNTPAIEFAAPTTTDDKAWAKFRAAERAIERPIEVATALPSTYHESSCATCEPNWINKAGSPRCDCQLRDELVRVAAALPALDGEPR